MIMNIKNNINIDISKQQRRDIDVEDVLGRICQKK